MSNLGHCDWGSCDAPAVYVAQLRRFEEPGYVCEERAYCADCAELDRSCWAGSDWGFVIYRRAFEDTSSTAYQPWASGGRKQRA